MTTAPAFVPATVLTAPPAPEDLCVAVFADRVVLADDRLPSVAAVGLIKDLTPLGTLRGQPIWSGRLTTAPAGLTALDWSALAAHVDPETTRVAARGLQLIRWRARHRWCGACRAELVDLEPYLARQCPECGVREFAGSQPVALVAILRDGPAGPEILLARHTYRDTETWQLIGGWADPAETLEQAAVREAAEEVGLAVTDLVYFGSEAWGVDGPGVLVTLFTARSADPTAEPSADLSELSDARFFPLSALPTPRLPSHHISGRLLDMLASS